MVTEALPVGEGFRDGGKGKGTKKELRYTEFVCLCSEMHENAVDCK